jgi:ribosomal protein L37AE/L43A
VEYLKVNQEIKVCPLCNENESVVNYGEGDYCCEQCDKSFKIIIYPKVEK